MSSIHWRNPTDSIFTTDSKYFYFFVCKKKDLKNPVKQIFSFSIAIWCLHGVVLLQKKWRCAFVPFVFECVSYILCSGMWNINLKKKKKKKKIDLPTLFFFLCYANQTIFFFRPYVHVLDSKAFLSFLEKKTIPFSEFLFQEETNWGVFQSNFRFWPSVQISNDLLYMTFCKLNIGDGFIFKLLESL